MRLVWHQRPHLDRKLELGEAFRKGISYPLEIVHGFQQVVDADVLLLFGIGGIAKHIRDAYQAAGRKWILVDKAYTRKSGHYRISVNASQPLAYFACNRPANRWEALGIDLQPYRPRPGAILFDGASQKYCDWYDLGPFRSWGGKIMEQMRGYTHRPIIYRPRPTHNQRLNIDGSPLSERPLQTDFEASALVVSYGGNIGFDAVIAGLPHFAIGDSIARPLSETDWERLDQPRIPTDDERRQWCADLAYCQWTPAEIASGRAWTEIEPFL